MKSFFVYRIGDDLPGIGLVVSKRITETRPRKGEFVPVKKQEYRVKYGRRLFWISIEEIRKFLRYQNEK